MMRSIEGISNAINSSGNFSFERGTYEINKTHDTLLNADFYDLVGVLDNGMLIVIRSPFSRIESALRVITKVFNNIMVGLLIFGSVFILAFSNIFSAPIKRLSHAAKEMTELNFDVKVPVATR